MAWPRSCRARPLSSQRNHKSSNWKSSCCLNGQTRWIRQRCNTETPHDNSMYRCFDQSWSHYFRCERISPELSEAKHSVRACEALDGLAASCDGLLGSKVRQNGFCQSNHTGNSCVPPKPERRKVQYLEALHTALRSQICSAVE